MPPAVHSAERSAEGAGIEPELPLETIEFELALGALDLLQTGFEGGLRRALAMTGGAILFQVPAAGDSGFQRIAGVVIGEGEEGITAVVSLSADGTAVTVETASEVESPYARFAASCRGLAPWLATTPQAAAA